MEALLKFIFDKLLAPLVIKLVLDFMHKWEGDPEFKEKARAVKSRLDAAKTEKEHLDASSEIQALLRS